MGGVSSTLLGLGLENPSCAIKERPALWGRAHTRTGSENNSLLSAEALRNLQRSLQPRQAGASG